jgi:UDP-N-acetyl-D-galactosamine dehydrogenase
MRKVSVIGLGYVGLPVAVAFGKQAPVVGFDINARRIAELEAGKDRTGEVSAEDLAQADITYTHRVQELRRANFHIVTVSTPVDEANQPDLRSLLKASETVGQALKHGDIVVYESTVYPGVTEEACAPVLERESGLKCGEDFFLGYSPERINPGDKTHTFTQITKVVSGQTPAVLEMVAAAYGSVVEAGVYKAPSIKVAETAKVIENTQRDLNVALMNELALICNRLGIDTQDVLEAAGTKWNFLPFRPGLVGGHCIGVDPYYLTHKAERVGYTPQVILSGRRINDSMGQFIAQCAIKEMIRAGHDVHSSIITVLGVTFKEDCSDLRNSRVMDVIRELREFGINLQITDAHADVDEAFRDYGVALVPWEALRPAEIVIVAVPHEKYRLLDVAGLANLLKDNGLILDVKSIFPREECARAGIRLWRL